MADYDYKEGKKRVKEVLDSKLDVIKEESLPSDENFTFDNSYYSWVTAVFVDIRDSSSLFHDENKIKVSKIIRSFTSEIIEILRNDPNRREIGIRGDCVYAVYSTPKKKDISEVYNKTVWINTLMKMLNKQFAEKDYPEIKVGIGVSSAQELVIKAGRKNTGINSKVWIGSAVTTASNLSSLGKKNFDDSLVYSECSYNNFIEDAVAENSEAKTWFTKCFSNEYGTYYHANIVKTGFNNWIQNGMPDN